MTRTTCGFVFLAAALSLPLIGQAQTTSKPVPQQPPPTGNNASRVPPERIEPPGATMSDKLSKSNGTLKPPDVDPGMAAKPPSTASDMPVIPPPGTPGNKSGVQPK
jgi:hypothetical protein